MKDRECGGNHDNRRELSALFRKEGRLTEVPEDMADRHPEASGREEHVRVQEADQESRGKRQRTVGRVHKMQRGKKDRGDDDACVQPAVSSPKRNEITPEQKLLGKPHYDAKQQRSGHLRRNRPKVREMGRAQFARGRHEDAHQNRAGRGEHPAQEKLPDPFGRPGQPEFPKRNPIQKPGAYPDGENHAGVDRIFG